ncbi:MAG: CorA family divalent cation transporter [Candidatus Paceibacterota bacterium]
MTTTHAAKGLVWIDLQSPTDDEISVLVKRYSLHPLVGEELKSSPSVVKIDFYKDYILVVLTLPIRVKKDDGYTIVDCEVDFVVGKNFLITSRFEAIEQLEYFAKIFETNSILNKGEKIEHAGHLFYYMVMRLYGGMCSDLENIRDSLLMAETRIFGGDERKMVEVLSGLSRQLIDFRQTARVHRDVWDNMTTFTGKELFNQDFAPYINDLRDEFNRCHDLIVNARELLADLRETNDSLLNTRQNDIIRTLTIINFIFIPATFIASLFTIPASFVPLIEKESGWITILVVMIAITTAIWVVVKRKKWL